MKALYDVPAPAKLNLFLHVTGRRADGFHLLQSAFMLIDWHDTLHFEARGDGLLSREDSGATLPADDLCLRAARTLQQALIALVHRLHALHLLGAPDLQMVVQVGAYARGVVHHGNLVPGQQGFRADAGELQNLRRADGASRQNGFATRLDKTFALFWMHELDARCEYSPFAGFSSHAFHHCAGDDREIGA